MDASAPSDERLYELLRRRLHKLPKRRAVEPLYDAGGVRRGSVLGEGGYAQVLRYVVSRRPRAWNQRVCTGAFFSTVRDAPGAVTRQ